MFPALIFRTAALLKHYEILGLTCDATQDEIKKAFRTLTKKYHPDRNRVRTRWATGQMMRLIEAHRVLSNVSTRARYDQRHRGHVSTFDIAGTSRLPLSLG